jgi:electron transfer flavoprotein alpha/beta subunit
MIGVWLGAAPPHRSVRWIDGALGAAAKLENAIAIVAGDQTWIDLAADRATRAGLPIAAIQTELKLDYLGWAQIVAAAARELDVFILLVDEVSRPERFPEVAAIADQLDAAQLTRVVALAAEDDVIHASRAAGRDLQTIRVKGPAVIGVRIAGAFVDEYPTPTPTAGIKKMDLQSLGLDPLVLGHRALPPRQGSLTKKSVDRIVDHLSVHRAPRRP